MRECKLTVLSWRRFLKSRPSFESIDIHVFSNHLARLFKIMREQPNIFAAHITLSTAATCQKPSYSDSKYPRIKAVVAGLAGLASAGPLFWLSMLSAMTIFSRFGSFFFVLTCTSDFQCNDVLINNTGCAFHQLTDLGKV